jgi:hypothetical protein
MVYTLEGVCKEILAPIPSEQTSAMEQGVQFIADWLNGDYLKIELRAAHGISYPTADKWIKRYLGGTRHRAPGSTMMIK